MQILIVGANGDIGRRLITLIASGPHQSRAMIRHPEQSSELYELGADETVVADLEKDVSSAVNGCDAIIFTAGSGGNSGPEKTDAVDRDGAIAVIDAAAKAGVKRFIMVSSMGADMPDEGPDELQHYLLAKQVADDHLRKSGLHYTIVRPGSLTDENGSGKVDASEHLGRQGSIPRDDVAAVLVAVLDAPNTQSKQFELIAGQTAVKDAVAAI
jgi:uncharacterized protein YbjT (DUF2867 family)